MRVAIIQMKKIALAPRILRRAPVNKQPQFHTQQEIFPHPNPNKS
jgi:hypothetical protein